MFGSAATALLGRASGTPGILALALGMALLPFTAGCGSLTAKGQNAEGVRLFDQARYQEAITQFEKAVNNDPRNPDGYYNLAETYHRLGILSDDQSYLDQAEQYYNRCLDHDEDHRECYRGLTVLLAEQDRTEEAFRLLEGWADRNPTSPDAKIELARLFEEIGDPEAAKAHLVEAVSIDHKNPRALAALGRLREQMGEQSLALDSYRRSLRYNPFQEGVAARVAVLQSSVNTPNLSAPPLPGAASDTRTVTRNTAPLR